MNALNLDQLINHFRGKGHTNTADFLEGFKSEEWDGYPISRTCSDGWIEEDFAKCHLFGLKLTEESEQAWREIKANVTTAVYF